nr:ATP-binding cassette domain-containing protein [Bradyrhizobium sp. USDA 4541]
MLTMSNLNVRYGPVHAVRGVSIEVPEQTIVALLGANGAGKSSVLAACMGLLPSTADSLTFADKTILGARTEELVRVGMTLTPEGRKVFPGLTVAENLAMGSAGTAKLRARGKVIRESVLELFPRLSERLNQKAGSLSGGEQQMLAIGRSLMSEPKLLLLDEPSLGLAPNIVDQIFDLIVLLNKTGTTILLVEQNAEVSLDISHTAFVLRGGEVAVSGSSADLRRRGNLGDLYFGV